MGLMYESFAPVPADVHAERIEIYNWLIPDFKIRIRKALGAKQTRDVDDCLKEMVAPNRYSDVDNDDWTALLHAVMVAYCHAAILNKVRYTPKKYRHEWTMEELNHIMDDCELTGHNREWILESVQKYCPYLTDAIGA